MGKESGYSKEALARENAKGVAMFEQDGVDIDAGVPREFSNPWAQQNRFEFSMWLTLMKAARPQSLLEIGSCFGHSLLAMARLLPRGARVVSVDICQGAGDLANVDIGKVLQARVNQLCAEGYDAVLIKGDSQKPGIIEKVSCLGAFDVCFIDGAHDFAGVQSDWDNYGRYASIAAFHDIVNPYAADVARLWQMVSYDPKRSTVEIVGSKMGIGVVYNAVPKGAFVGSEFTGWVSKP